MGNAPTPSMSVAPPTQAPPAQASSTTTTELKPKTIFKAASVYIGLSMIIFAVLLVTCMLLMDGRQREERLKSCYMQDAPTIIDLEDGKGTQTDDDSTDTRTRNDSKEQDVEIIDFDAARKQISNAEGLHSDRTFGKMGSMESIPID